MGFKDLPAAERLRILRAEGGYQGWLREQARARNGDSARLASTGSIESSELIDVSFRVPAVAAPLLQRIVDAVALGDAQATRHACSALQSLLDGHDLGPAAIKPASA